MNEYFPDWRPAISPALGLYVLAAVAVLLQVALVGSTLWAAAAGRLRRPWVGRFLLYWLLLNVATGVTGVAYVLACALLGEGAPVIGIGVAIVVFTVWSYFGHPQATHRRLFIILTLRLLALVVALIAALRPTVGVNENPNQPSVILVGVDTSKSMTVEDEIGGQARDKAVRKMLEKCQPVLDELAAQNVNVVVYRFSTPDFSEGVNRYDPQTPFDGLRSDYGTYLNRTFERWFTERYLRAHLLIGDGQDNGETYSAAAEAARYGRRGTPVHTFVVGQQGSDKNARDIVVSSVTCNPSPASIKTPVTVTAHVNAYGFQGARVIARVYINDDPKEVGEFTLDREKGNELKVPVKAPDAKGEYKVKVEVGLEENGKIVKLPGEQSALNNSSETYLTVTKDGVRVLVIDQQRWENTLLRDALRDEKRFDVYEVIRQTDQPPTAAEREALDLEKQAYDVVIIGNVSAAHLKSASDNFLEKLTELATKKGVGVMFLGGEFAFNGVPADLLPITGGPIVDNLSPNGTPLTTYPTIPTARGLEKMFRLSRKPGESEQMWDRLNNFRTGARINGYNRLTLPKGGLYTVYAWTTAANDQKLTAAGSDPQGDPLLVGSQRGDASKGRWLAFGAFDTYLWRTLGQPKTREGIEMHDRFWRQCVLWLAHQDEEEGQAYARPQFRQLKVTAEQTVRVGVKKPSGEDDPAAPLTVRILPLAPGQQEPKPEDEKKVPPMTVLSDAATPKEGRKVVFRPTAPGEYFVSVESPMKTPEGQPVLNPDGSPKVHRGTAKFIAVPDVSDEMLQVNANPEFMLRLSQSTGGKALRLEDLPGFLRELKDEKLDPGAKKLTYYPNWHRNRSKGFLPFWLVVFVALLGAEWGLRRLWGMI